MRLSPYTDGLDTYMHVIAILDAFEKDVRAALSDAPHNAASLILHYTTAENEKHESDDEDIKDSGSDVSMDDFSAREGRPDIQTLVGARIQSCKGRMLVAGTCIVSQEASLDVNESHHYSMWARLTYPRCAQGGYTGPGGHHEGTYCSKRGGLAHRGV